VPGKSLNISLIQSHLEWENQEKNLAHFETMLPKRNSSHWVVLPETFATGFALKSESAECSEQVLNWMKIQASERNCIISGSVLVATTSGKLENRFYFVFPNGNCNWYAKRHAFSLAGEQHIVQGGTERTCIAVEGWEIAPQVCYDLRFPVWSRYSPNYAYHILVYTANWPAIRAQAWNRLLVARAIENQCYVLGVNRIGSDGNGIEHQGDTQAIGFNGNVIVQAPTNTETCLNVTLDLEPLLSFRKQFPFLEDADNFSLNL